MRTLILCEGKTDAVLLSYLLGKEAGWKYTREKNLWMIDEDDRRDESANWYKRGKDYILICGVGGKTNFGNYFLNNLYQPILQEAHKIDRLVYVIDKDNDCIEDLKNKIEADLQPICNNIIIGEWAENVFIDPFGMSKKIDILALIVPENQEGALENVLLDAISEREYDKNLVDKSILFVEEIKDEAREYIINSRLELKAKLSVVFAIRSPQKVFSLIDELIKSVDWEKYQSIKSLFQKILAI